MGKLLLYAPFPTVSHRMLGKESKMHPAELTEENEALPMAGLNAAIAFPLDNCARPSPFLLSTASFHFPLIIDISHRITKPIPLPLP